MNTVSDDVKQLTHDNGINNNPEISNSAVAGRILPGKRHFIKNAKDRAEYHKEGQINITNLFKKEHDDTYVITPKGLELAEKLGMSEDASELYIRIDNRHYIVDTKTFEVWEDPRKKFNIIIKEC